MCYRMSRSWRRVLVGMLVMAGLLLALSAATADSDKEKQDRGRETSQGQPAADRQAQPPPGHTPPAQVQDKKTLEAPGQARGLLGRATPAEPPRGSSPPANPWQTGRLPGQGLPGLGWGRQRPGEGSASTPSQDRLVWGRPLTRTPEGQPLGGGDRTGGRWIYRPEPGDRTQREIPYRPTNSEPDTRSERQTPDQGGQSNPASSWPRGPRHVTTDLPDRGVGSRPDAQSRKIAIPKQPDRTSGRDQERPADRGGNTLSPPARPTHNQPPGSLLKERQAGIPGGNFRGPEAEKNVSVLPKGEGERVKRDLRERLRQINLKPAKPDPPKLDKDVVGNLVPPDAQLLSRRGLTHISVSYRNVCADLGTPFFHYVFLPRTMDAYWNGYWDGYADGYWAAQHLYHHRIVVLDFYYPYYYSDPHWVAFWYADLYPSVYHYWGWCPGWVYPQRVYYAPVEYIYVPRTPYRYYYTGYSLDEVGAEQAIQDLRQAWFDSDIDRLAYHLTDQQDIQVYFDGEYEYTAPTEDYYAMTADAMATTHTTALDFDRPIWISSHEVFVTGRHIFYDPDGVRNTVYVSYRLRRLGGEWYIVAVGSSLEPIRHRYQDFRYS